MKNQKFKFKGHTDIDLLYAYGRVKPKDQTGLFFINIGKEIISEAGFDTDDANLTVTITAYTPYTIMGNARLFKVVEGGKNEQIYIDADIELNPNTGTATARLVLNADTDYIVMVEHVLSDKQINFSASIR